MKTILILFLHIGFDAAFGWCLLNFSRHDRSAVETLLAGSLLGIYIETLSTATLMFLGISFAASTITTGILMVLTTGFLCRRTSPHKPGRSRFSMVQPHWYEWAVLAAVAEKVLFAAWQLVRFHTYFDDALMHWSGRARSLFGSVNWSMDAASPYFMGKQIGNINYPLLTVIWRAVSAEMNGSWNELISRADGLIYFVVIAGIVWAAIRRFSNLRWLAAAAAFTVSAIPLQVWHAAGGYSDIAVEAFLAAALAAILRGEWLISGVMAAGVVWSKNDGLVLYVPSLLLAVLLIQIHQSKVVAKWRDLGSFLLGAATISPWLVFNFVHSLGVTPGESQIAWHPDAFKLLWNAFITSSTSGFVWTCLLLAAIYVSGAMSKQKIGQALMLFFSATVLAIGFVFTSTNAYAFLVDETTIHRTLMQFSATAILIVTYGLSLKMTCSEAPRRAQRK